MGTVPVGWGYLGGGYFNTENVLSISRDAFQNVYITDPSHMPSGVLKPSALGCVCLVCSPKGGHAGGTLRREAGAILP